MSLDENLTKKRPGDPILSADWNAVASETVRLDDAKLNRQSIGFQMFRAKQWANETTSGDWQPVISQTVHFETATSLLLVGQGHGLSETSGAALDVVFRVNGAILGHDFDTIDLSWGMGLLHPFGSNTSIWAQIVAIAECPVSSGESLVELVMRRRANGVEDGSVKFSAPTLWLIRLGAS